MSRKIKPTPVIKGKDAIRVLSQLQETDNSPKDKEESKRLGYIYKRFKDKGIVL